MATSSTAPTAAAPAARADRHLIFAITGISQLTFIMQFAMVGVSLPHLITDLHAPLRWGGWVLTTFMIGQVIAMALAGRLAERLGARTVFVGGFVLFAVGSAICALAPNIYVLISGRALQGLAGGGLMPAATTMIAAAYGSGRVRAIGYYSSLMPFGAVLGPGIGGLIVDTIGWRWTFGFNVFIGIAVFVFGSLLLPRGERRPAQRVDAAGITLIAFGVTAFIYALTELGRRDSPPNMPVVVASLGAALVSLVLLVRQERRTPVPIVDLDLLHRREFRAANTISFCFGVCWQGVFSMLPFYAQVAYSFSASRAGAVMSPRAAMMVAASTLSAYLLPRIGYRKPLATGLLGLAAALFVISRGLHDPTFGSVHFTSFWWLLAISVAAGGTFGLANPALNNAALDIAPDRIAAIAGLRGMFMSLGGTVGISLVVLAGSRAASTEHGMEVAFTAFACVMALATLLVRYIPEPHEIAARAGALHPAHATAREAPAR